MSTPKTDAERMRAVGLFDLHGDLTGMLRAVADFFEQHGIDRPLSLAQHFDTQRGWVADIELTPTQFLAVLADYPMPVSLEPAAGEDGTVLAMTCPLRAATLRATLPLTSAAAHVTAAGLLLTA